MNPTTSPEESFRGLLVDAPSSQLREVHDPVSADAGPDWAYFDVQCVNLFAGKESFFFSGRERLNSTDKLKDLCRNWRISQNLMV